ncbi:MAG TPA: ComEC/Rec2 family competence protein [Longimicrobiales bacterium]|nr:ComEC/Rec2 family competence protein [Longimicrobiales bacterium]
MSRPLPRLVHVTCGVAAGLLLGLRSPAAVVPLLLAPAIAAPAALLLARRAPGARLAVALAAAAGWALGAAAARSAELDCRTRLPDGAPLEVRGALEARPWPGEAAPLRLDSVRAAGAGRACAGTIRATLHGSAPAPPAGVELVAWGRWWAFPREGAWPRPATWAGTLALDSVRVLPGRAAGDPLVRWRAGVQALIRELFGRRAALVESLILAQQAGLDDAVRERFANSGLSHILAISGLHVGLVAGVVLLLARLLRLPALTAEAAAAAAATGYVLLLGAPPPAARSALQLLLVLASRRLQRPADPLALLAAGALAILAVTPLAALDAGFQLSFAGVAGIVVLRPRCMAALGWLRSKWLREALATGAAATAVTTPVAALQFGRIAPIALVANVPAVPIGGLAVPAAALALAVGAVAPAPGRFLAGGAGVLLDALDAVARLAAAVPGGHAAVSPDLVLAWALAAAAAVLAARWLAATGRAGAGAGPPGLAGARARARRARARAWVGAGAATAVLVGWPALLGLRGAGEVEIVAIDVGQGDGLAIRSPAGRWVVVDAGPRSDDFDAGRARMVPFLRSRGVRRVEALILTHPHADHIGGAQAVLDALPVGAVLDPAVASGTPLYLATLEDARRHGSRWLAARDGRRFQLDGMTIDFLAPPAGVLDDRLDPNDFSTAFVLRYGHFAALFMGDAPIATEERILAEQGAGVRVAVLKVGHHGSRTSTSEALLEAAAPQLALVSVGRRNRFGHPAPEVMARLARHEVRTLRTDRQGTLRVVVRPDGRWRVETGR